MMTSLHWTREDVIHIDSVYTEPLFLMSGNISFINQSKRAHKQCSQQRKARNKPASSREHEEKDPREPPFS